MDTPIIVEIPHDLGAAEARRRIDQGFASLAEQVGGPGLVRVERSWLGDRMDFSMGVLGQLITGQLLVMGDLVRIEVHLPSILAAFASAVRGRLKTGGQALLEKK
jgi:hypothetical protein